MSSKTVQAFDGDKLKYVFKDDSVTLPLNLIIAVDRVLMHCHHTGERLQIVRDSNGWLAWTKSIQGHGETPWASVKALSERIVR